MWWNIRTFSGRLAKIKEGFGRLGYIATDLLLRRDTSWFVTIIA